MTDYDALCERLEQYYGSATDEGQAAAAIRELRAELDLSSDNHGITSALLGDAIRENDALRAEIERLRGDLSETRIALANAECRERVAKSRLAEAERLLAKEGIHMDDHGCWCNPSVTNYGAACTCHLDVGQNWRADCPVHGFARTSARAPAARLSADALAERHKDVLRALAEGDSADEVQP